MRSRVAQVLSVAAIAAGSLLLALPAEAKCKKMGFLVNDYGKDGPTKDAQELLEKHIAEWAAQNGVTNYKVGKKDVTCELYLNLILFDEHTCTASANVCWDETGDAKPKSSDKKAPDTTASEGGKSKDKSSEAVKPAETPKKDVAETAPAEKKTEGTADEAATTAESNAPAAETGAKPETAAAPAKTESSVAETAPATTATPPAAPLETGAIGDATVPAAPSADADLAAKAAAAAERAAAAAERAAAAAERAAEAAAQRVPDAVAVPDQVELPAFGAPASGATVPPVAPKQN